MNIAVHRSLLASIVCMFAFAAAAQDVTGAVAVEAEAKATQSTDDADHQDRIADRHCLRATGSRIVARQNAQAGKVGKRCAIGPGRVHTSEDLERTGASSLGEALRRLEPSGR